MLALPEMCAFPAPSTATISRTDVPSRLRPSMSARGIGERAREPCECDSVHVNLLALVTGHGWSR
eukprot:295427-Prymnesium_polylepis.1